MTSRRATIRRVPLAEVPDFLVFASRLESPLGPPITESLLGPSSMILVAADEGRPVGLIRLEGDRRRTVTHLLLDPESPQREAGRSLLLHGLRMSWAAGAREVGGFIPVDSPLLAIAEGLGATRSSLHYWVSGPLTESSLFSDLVAEDWACDAELMAAVEAERRRRF